MRISQYQIPLEPFPQVEMPSGARILSLQPFLMELVGPKKTFPVVIWALVDETAPRCLRRFALVGTGHAPPQGIEEAVFLGTTQNGSPSTRTTFVLHVFDCGERDLDGNHK